MADPIFDGTVVSVCTVVEANGSAENTGVWWSHIATEWAPEEPLPIVFDWGG